MPEFASAAWFADLTAVAVDHRHPDLPVLVLEVTVVDARPDDIGCWHVELGDPVAVRRGPAPRADLALVTDRATGERLAAGTLNAQGAISEGRLQVRGDLRALAAAAPLLATIGRAR
jgi:hypothetical protein